MTLHSSISRISISPVFCVTCLCVLLALSACAPAQDARFASANVISALSGEADAGFARALTPIPFDFPRDHGPHPEYHTEWWYYTGNLAAESGREFGYQLTIFRSALRPEMVERSSDFATNQAYMAHFAVTDVIGREHAHFERFSRGAADLAGANGEPTFAVWLEDWRIEQSAPGSYDLVAQAQTDEGPIGLELTLEETRAPLLHGDQGLSQKGPEAGNASYYYSLVGLRSAGVVTLGDERVEVTGLSWMDHEYGTSALSENALGWDWFSLQLENGAVLMFAQIRTADGGLIPQFTGTYVDAAGKQYTIEAGEPAVTVVASWTSPHTGSTYPAAWELEIPAHALQFRIEPLVADQEMNSSYSYWEGAVRAVGTVDGRQIEGRGYVELTGYSSAAGSGTLR